MFMSFHFTQSCAFIAYFVRFYGLLFVFCRGQRYEENLIQVFFRKNKFDYSVTTSQCPPRSVPILRMTLILFRYSRSLCMVLFDTPNLCDKVAAFSTTLSTTLSFRTFIISFCLSVSFSTTFFVTLSTTSVSLWWLSLVKEAYFSESDYFANIVNFELR